ncbi:hypothetical protein GUJ93_ZPchr0007g5095 [Zizania palustris]|uniref:Uncharacterized protein n=1 Tax=Zizania palustris TaxID=103762 RepID=A0A8J5SQ42_ZIZPA|nr:hypothetical protein GUJ93_ZPchr0007g5095 [Zizania palustris]
MASGRISCIVLCLALIVVAAGAGLAATPAEARALAGGGSFGIGGLRRGRWNNARSLQGGKREVPGGPDPQHHC